MKKSDLISLLSKNLEDYNEIDLNLSAVLIQKSIIESLKKRNRVVNKLLSPDNDWSDVVSIVDPNAVHPPVAFSKLVDAMALAETGLGLPLIS